MRENGLSLDEAVNTVVSWEQLIQATAAAKAASRTRKDDDLIAYLPAQYVRIRRFSAPCMTAFTFEGNQQNRDFINIVIQMRVARKVRQRSTNPPWAKDALELLIIIELENRIAGNEIWIKGARTCRALDEDMISQQTYAIIKAEALDQKLREAANRLEAGRGDTRIGAKGLRVPAVKTTETEAAIAFARRVVSVMPPIG